MSYESWRISFQSSEQAARAAYAEAEALREEAAGWKCVVAAHAELHDEAEELAERLAEALREAYGQVRELCDCYGHSYPEASFARYEALLREQENSND